MPNAKPPSCPPIVLKSFGYRTIINVRPSVSLVPLSRSRCLTRGAGNGSVLGKGNEGEYMFCEG